MNIDPRLFSDEYYCTCVGELAAYAPEYRTMNSIQQITAVFTHSKFRSTVCENGIRQMYVDLCDLFNPMNKIGFDMIQKRICAVTWTEQNGGSNVQYAICGVYHLLAKSQAIVVTLNRLSGQEYEDTLESLNYVGRTKFINVQKLYRDLEYVLDEYNASIMVQTAELIVHEDHNKGSRECEVCVNGIFAAVFVRKLWRALLNY